MRLSPYFKRAALARRVDGFKRGQGMLGRCLKLGSCSWAGVGCRTTPTTGSRVAISKPIAASWMLSGCPRILQHRFLADILSLFRSQGLDVRWHYAYLGQMIISRLSPIYHEIRCSLVAEKNNVQRPRVSQFCLVYRAVSDSVNSPRWPLRSSQMTLNSGMSICCLSLGSSSYVPDQSYTDYVYEPVHAKQVWEPC